MTTILSTGALLLLVGTLTAAPLAGALPVPDNLAGALPARIPGLWISHGSTWDVAPAGGAGLAQKMAIPAAGYGFLSVALPAGFKVADITTFRFDAFFQSGSCGGGSPRVSLGVDTDGDGDRDGSVFVYAGPAPSFGGCPTGSWATYDLVDGAKRWDSSQLGGTFYGTQAQANQVAGSAHQVLTATLVYDSGWLFGPTVAWYDNIAVNCFELGEPVDIATSIAAGAGVCLPL